jgi:hypothetical protein
LVSTQDWHIPYHHDALTLQAAIASLPQAELSQVEQTLMLECLSNLNSADTGFQLFHGDVDQHKHNCIHIVLGRGLLKMDQAFIFGFTLGSAKKGIMAEETLNAYISRHLHTSLASLNEEELAVFKDAVKLASISSCVALDRFNFADWQDQPIRVLRDVIGLEHDLIAAHYAVEQRRYPHNKASQRLVPASKQVVAF